jgi:hypothetical protein
VPGLPQRSGEILMRVLRLCLPFALGALFTVLFPWIVAPFIAALVSLMVLVVALLLLIPAFDRFYQ